MKAAPTEKITSNYIKSASDDQLKADSNELTRKREENAALLRQAKQKWYSMPTRSKAQKEAAAQAEREYNKYAQVDNYLGYALAAIGTEMDRRHPPKKKKTLQHGGGYR